MWQWARRFDGSDSNGPNLNYKAMVQKPIPTGFIAQMAASVVYWWIIGQESIEMPVSFELLRPNPHLAQQLLHATLTEARSNSLRGRHS